MYLKLPLTKQKHQSIFTLTSAFSAIFLTLNFSQNLGQHLMPLYFAA